MDKSAYSMGRLCCMMSLFRTLALIFSCRVCSGLVSMRILSNVTQCEADQCKESVSCGIGADWTCCSLNAALELVKHYNDSNSTISMLLPPGQHVLDSPVHLGSTSMELIGLQDTSGSPVTIVCTYNITVDQDQIFNLSYVYTDYTLYFKHSESVSISNINMNSCQFSLRLDTIGTVVIRNCSFQYFTEAVFDIFNSVNVTIVECVFFNNSGTGISRNSFRANTGAVAIGFNDIELDQPQAPHVYISNCNFTRNRATADSFFRSTDTAFASRIFTGRGGGLGIFVNDSRYNIEVMIYDSVFINNFARSYGGGLFMIIFGKNTQNIFQVRRSVFEKNMGELGAGGILMTFNSVGVRGAPHTTIVSDCSFSRNSGVSGGGMLTGLTGQVNSLIILERCNFTQNKGLGLPSDLGSAYTVWLVPEFRERESLPKYNMTDCIFENNNGTNGVVSLGYAPFSFYGRNIFTRNEGTSALRVVGSLVEVYGAMEFLDNEVGDAGALELLSSSQMQLHDGARMLFRKNKGRFGASILVGYGISLRALPKLLYNPQCFILYENSDVPPSDWINVSIAFRENKAVLSSSVYASTFRECSWFSSRYPFFNQQSVLEWPLWDLGNDSINTGYEDMFAPEYYIGTEAIVIDTSNTAVKAWPGYVFKLPLTGWDEFYNPTAVVTRFNSIENKDFEASIIPQIVLIEAGGANSTLISEFSLTYTLSRSNAVLQNNSIGEVVVSVPFESSEVTSDKFKLYSDLCPGGYGIRNYSRSRLECQCLEQSIDKVVHCEEDQDSVIIEDGYWVSTIPSAEAHAHLIHFYTCPAGYCRCLQNSSVGIDDCVYVYVNSNPDAQCSCNRYGILCGSCKDQGVSVLSNRCVSCSNAFSFLIPLLIVAQVALFITIVLVDKKFMTLLYPFTFYIQVIPFTGSYFHETFFTAGQYLRYISSALSFYFPYDFCIYNNMDTLVSYILRYLPFLVAIVVIPITLVIRRVKWKRKLKHHGVWTIVLLIYGHTVHTCMSVLSCHTIIDGSGATLSRWFPNGNIECFTGRHLPVTLLSLFVLLLSLLLIPVVAAIATGKLPSLNGWEWTKHFQISFCEGFKEQYKWWAAVELSRRLVFIFLVVLFPRRQVAVLLLICAVLTLYGLLQPYENSIVNVIEHLVQLNSIVLLIMVTSGMLEPYYALSAADTANDSCSAVSSTAPATWVLLPLYYFPPLLLVIVFSIAAGRRMRNKIKEKKVKSDKTEEYTGSTYCTNYLALRQVTVNELELPSMEAEHDLRVMSSSQ